MTIAQLVELITTIDLLAQVEDEEKATMEVNRGHAKYIIGRAVAYLRIKGKVRCKFDI